MQEKSNQDELHLNCRFFEPQNPPQADRSDHFIMLRFLVLLFDIQCLEPSGVCLLSSCPMLHARGDQHCYTLGFAVYFACDNAMMAIR